MDINYFHEYLKIKKKYLDLKQTGQIGGSKSTPVFIMFSGFRSSKIWWGYKYTGSTKLEKLSFLSELKKLGDTYTFTSKFWNVDYYNISKNKKDRIKWGKIYKKYKPHTKDIDFNIKDLDYKNICQKVYKDIINKYGTNRKYIPVGHSYGGPLAILFSKMYKKKCLFTVAIDNTPYNLEFYKKYNERKNKNIAKRFNTNKKLHTFLTKLKDKLDETKPVMHKEIKDFFKMVAYRSSQDRVKYYDKKLHVPTLFFKAFRSNPIKKFEKVLNKFAVQEKKNLLKHNNQNTFKYFIMLDATHFIWNDETYSKMIIDEIKCMLKNN